MGWPLLLASSKDPFPPPTLADAPYSSSLDG
jgi:hypothetical protein